jgi:TPR repeat protein
MGEESVPSAEVRSPLPPWWQREAVLRQLRLLIGIAAVIGTYFVLRYWWHSDDRRALARARAEHTAAALMSYVHVHSADDVRGDLRAMQDEARAKLASTGASHPHGIDPLFAALLAHVRTGVAVTGPEPTIDTKRFAATGDTGKAFTGLSLSSCATGLGSAFHELTDSDVVTFDTLPALDTDASSPELHLALSIEPSHTRYRLPNSDRGFPGITVAASVTLTAGNHQLAAFHATVEPSASISFTTYGPAMPLALDPSADDYAIPGALLQGACEQLGYRLAGELTGIAPPKKADEDPIEQCKRGFNCLATGLALRDGDGMPADRAKAQEILGNTCEMGMSRSERGPACVAAADLLLDGSGAATDDDRARAWLWLQMGCDMGNYGPACLEEGELHRGESRESLNALVRACDFGQLEGCERAAPILAKQGIDGTPLPDAAAVLAKRSCGDAPACPLAAKYRPGRGLPLGGGTIFDVRWGQWTQTDTTGGVALWIAYKGQASAPTLSQGLRFRELPLDEVPDGIAVPPGTSVVGIVYPQMFPSDTPCMKCTPWQAEQESPMMMMMNLGCHCAITR